MTLATPLPAVEGTVLQGTAVARDGDDLVVAGQRVRLTGIDAPELTQTCAAADGAPWACGAWARGQLRALVDGRAVTCTAEGQDRHGRMLAVCRAGGRDLNAALVAAGAAWTYHRDPGRYAAPERAARDAGRGIWQGPATRPEAVRRAARGVAAPEDGAQTPARCVLKGNIARSGERILHAPGQRDYAATRIDAGRGERWFCTRAAARAAGWRPAHR